MNGTLQVIHKLKRQMLYLHKSVWPLREVINFLTRSETPLVKESVDVSSSMGNHDLYCNFNAYFL